MTAHKAPAATRTATLRADLERLYARYNHRAFVAPDPLQFLYAYEDPRDREVVGLLAATLAYGRVAQIVRSVGRVLARLGPAPAAFLTGCRNSDITGAVAGFRHRFTTDRDIAALLLAVRNVLLRHGSLCSCFRACLRSGDATVLPALDRFVRELAAVGPGLSVFTLPQPGNGSACKRLNLFLRWMVRQDAVDPGGWEGVDPAMLIVPLDTHMFTVGRALGFTRRRQADCVAALEITEGFRRIAPEDPVRYDFVLTRIGMRSVCIEKADVATRIFSENPQLRAADRKSNPSG